MKLSLTGISTIAAGFAAAVLTFGQPTPSHAAGSGTVYEPTVKCPKGRVWSDSRGRCVKRNSSSLTDDDKYKNAMRFAYAGQYADALDMLKLVENQKQARVLNMMGFATRKLGRVNEGLSLYKQALSIDPNYVLAREYMGEGYLQKGDLAGAERQLSEIGARCGEVCPEYLKLARAIAEYRKTGNFIAKNQY